MAKIIKVSDMRDLEAQVIQGKITYGRMLELIEDKVFEGCILKDDLLAHIDKLIEGEQKQEATFKEAEMEISELTSGAMAMAYQIVRNFVGRHAPDIEAAKNKISKAASNVAHHESMVNEMRAAQGQPSSIECLFCGHKWKIEIPAVYKETFCPKCGE